MITFADTNVFEYTMKQYNFILAPLRGYTNKEYRYVLTKNFKYISSCYMPFFSVTDSIPTKFSKYMGAFTEDELNHNISYQVVPQIIGNKPASVAGFCMLLRDNGFPVINFNLGCPMPQITKKTRGCGLLPHPDMIRSILDEVFKIDGINFSVKIRLGLKSKDEILSVIPVLNDYPLDSVTVHPRLSTDRYEGVSDIDTFGTILPSIKSKVIYNGDIVDNESFKRITSRFAELDTFMIGRGLLYKPFLTEELQSETDFSYEERIERFQSFYADLLEALKGKQNYMSQIKAYWAYFKNLYKDGEERYKRIVKS